MIFTIPLTIFYGLLQGLLLVIPSASLLPASFNESMTYIFGFLYGFDFLIPTAMIAICLSIAMGYAVVYMAWLGLHWVLSKIPFLHIK